MKKKLLFSLVITLGLLLGTFSIVTATASEPVGADWCVIWLPDQEFNWHDFPGEGQLVYNPQNNIWNLSCHGHFDYEQFATWEEFCDWIPGTCIGNQMVANRLAYFHDYFDDEGNYLWTDEGSATLIVKQNGDAKWNAQISYNCLNHYEMNEATIELPEGYWTVGPHGYTIEYYDEAGYSEFYSVAFMVDPTAPMYRGQVRLGLFFPGSFGTPLDTINSAQDTFMQVTYYGPQSYFTPLDYAIFTIDGGEAITVDAGPVHNMCSIQGGSLWMRHWGPKY